MSTHTRIYLALSCDKTDKGGQMYINVGAKHHPHQWDIITKAALKKMILTNPANVLIYSTEALGDNAGKRWTADNLDIGVRYTVVGPNPYTSRKWYATVERLQDGRITVK